MIVNAGSNIINLHQSFVLKKSFWTLKKPLLPFMCLESASKYAMWTWKNNYRYCLQTHTANVFHLGYVLYLAIKQTVVSTK